MQSCTGCVGGLGGGWLCWSSSVAPGRRHLAVPGAAGFFSRAEWSLLYFAAGLLAALAGHLQALPDNGASATA